MQITEISYNEKSLITQLLIQIKTVILVLIAASCDLQKEHGTLRTLLARTLSVQTGKIEKLVFVVIVLNFIG